MKTTKREILIKQAKEKYGVVTNISNNLNQDWSTEHSEEYGFDDFHYEECIDTLYSHPEGECGLVVYKNGNWAQVKEQSRTFKVTRQALAEILPHVCSDYRDKINKLAQKDLFSNEIEVSEAIVRQAHKEHTKSVHKEWLNKYLPLPKKKKIEIVGILTVDGGFSKCIDKNISTRNNYKLITLANLTYSYDIFSADFEGDVRVYYGYWGDGIAED